MEVSEDLAEFTRKIRLTEYFHNCIDNDNSLVRNKSNFVPPKGRNQALDEFIRSVEKIPLNKQSRTINDNLRKQERQSIRSLSTDTNIIIKEADKGGSVVIMDTEHYKKMVNELLQDTSYYEQIDGNPKNQNCLKYNKMIKKHETA
ncbi:MAG: hypothetical protein AB2693_23545 [Candidatus Thiodiazotropha sp.]